MTRENNINALVVMLAGILVTACAMVLAVFLAGSKTVVVVMNSPVQAAPASAGGAVAAAATPATPAIPEVVMARVPSLPPAGDLFDPAWEKAPRLDVPLQAQAITQPMLENPTITTLAVQGLRDSGRAAWRVSWAAPAPSGNVDVGKFSDAVAIQFAADPATPFVMGGKGKPVHILHWKALWQKDIDEGYQEVQHLHPNLWWDFYWFAEPRASIAKMFQNPAARQYLVAMAAGNPMALPDRKQPVEEIMAEGFGSATHVKQTAATGKGVWKDGRWTVVIERPLSGEDSIAKVLAAPAPSVAFAVWDGGAANVGGRKHYCNWVPLKVQP